MVKKATNTIIRKKIKKKKTVPIFHKNAEVIKYNTAISDLVAEQQQAHKDIENIFEKFQSSNNEPEDFLDRLPLETLKEIEDFEFGKNKKVFPMGVLKERTKLLKERDEKIKHLDTINKSITENNIDLLLSKIKCVMESLDE